LTVAGYVGIVKTSMKRHFLSGGIFLLFTLIAGTGCSVYQINAEDTSFDINLPKNAADKILYQEKIDGPYELIGVVSVTTEKAKLFEDVLPGMQQEAAALGGDVLTGVRSEPAGAFRVKYTAKVAVLK